MRSSLTPTILCLTALSSSVFDAPTAMAQWSTAALSEARYEIYAVEVDGVALFAGGVFDSDTVDLYHSSTESWSIHQLSEARLIFGGARIGSKALFIGGVTASQQRSDNVDIYDAASDTWSVAALSQPRSGITTAVAGTKVFIAGGVDPAVTNSVDVYDAATDSWTLTTLSVARTAMAGASVGNYALFAGGWDYSTFFTTVDIYDASTGSWSVAQLSQARSHITAQVVGSKVIFAGGTIGWPLRVVDIFDSSTGTWSTAQLASRRNLCASVTVGSKALFIGGGHFDLTLGVGMPSRLVDIYDDSTGAWSTWEMNSHCGGHRSTTVVGGKVLIGGQAIWSPTAFPVYVPVVDVYDASADIWYATELSQPRIHLAALTVGGKAMFAGGEQFGAGVYDTVDIYEELGTEYCVASPNSTGLGAEMFMVGSKRLADDSLGLRAGPIPDTLSLFVYSPAAQVVPFADGYSCVGAPLFRLDPPLPAVGRMAAKRVLTSQLSLVPGTLYFQCFYRDPAAGGTGLNSSNGYALDFVP
ncbi:MAG: hypothetical protein E2O39_05955 [Planctomycetota bacterium]|nr:MAG: hypothetical protein E2O39_05955 [Planctomycetota bacterium]